MAVDAAAKRRLRDWGRSRRESLSAEARAEHSAAICTRVRALPEWRRARIVALYLDVPGEVAVCALSSDAPLAVFPRVVGRELAFHRLEGAPVANAIGILEPSAGAAVVAASDVDLFVVPGLAFDRAGGRIGFGGGYYDRLFAHPEVRGFRAGVGFEAQLSPEDLPLAEWDAAMDCVVTEREVVRIDPERKPWTLG